MDVRKRIGLRSLALLSIPLMAIVALAWGQVANATVQAAGTGPEMSLTISGPGVSCSDGVCDAPFGGDIMLTVDIVTAPIEGYILVQTYIDYGSDLIYQPRAEAADELIWPDAGSDEVVLRFELAPGEVNHGGLTGLIPPLPASSYEGTILELDLVCSDAFSQTAVRMLPLSDTRTSGAAFAFNDGTTQVDVPTKTNTVVVNCGEAPPRGEAPPPPTPSQPTSLPSTGTFGTADSDSAGLWVMFGALLAAGVTGLTTFTLRVFSRRQIR